MKLSWLIARRFRQSKYGNRFVSFISASSTLGIGLGCFVLILILSVMNGFENQLKEKILSLISHGELKSVDVQGIPDWSQHIQKLKNEPGVISATPLIKLTGLLQKGNRSKAAEISAINPKMEEFGVRSSVSDTQWQAFADNGNSILLGRGVLQTLKLSIGDKVQLMLPRLSEDGSLKAPRVIWLHIAGEVKVGGELDSHIAYMHLEKAAALADVKFGARSIELRFEDPFQAAASTRKIAFSFPQHIYISDWTRTQGHLYQDIQLVRVVVYIALILLIAVACFNIVSTLVMSVNEKQAEVAMLKTMGAENGLIVQIFVLQGLLNGLTGTLFGAISGVLVAQNLSSIASRIESVLGIQFLSGDIYFIDFLPSKLDWNDVIITITVALGMSLLATIYPGIKATKVEPARVLGR